MDIARAETASQDSRASSLRLKGDVLTTIQIPEDPPVPPSATSEASGLERIPNDLPLTLSDGIIFTFTHHPSTGSDSISMSTPSPGGDSLSSILTSPPTPKLTAHELALLGTKHSRRTSQKREVEGTPWFHSAMRSKETRKGSVSPTWSPKKKNSGRELVAWFFVVMVVVILLAVVVPVTLILDKDDDTSYSSTPTLTHTTQQLITTSPQNDDVTNSTYTTATSSSTTPPAIFNMTTDWHDTEQTNATN